MTSPTPSGAATLDVEELRGLCERLRGQYAIGPHLPNGLPEFGYRQFQCTPINREAADAITGLAAKLAASEADAAIGRAFMDRLPEGYAYSDCPTELVTDLTNKLSDSEALREALKAAEKFVPTYEPWMDARADADLCGTYRKGGTYGDLRRARALLSSEAPNG